MALLGINSFVMEGGITDAYIQYMHENVGTATSGIRVFSMGASAEDPSRVFTVAFVESQEKMDAYFGSVEIIRRGARLCPPPVVSRGDPHTPTDQRSRAFGS